MLSKVLKAAVLVSVLAAGVAEAQSLAQLGGPVNLPPAGFTGQQFVDNRGCLFLRAGYGATVNWVPRVDRRHKPLCGFPPTFGAAVIAAVAVDEAPEPNGVVAALEPVAAARPLAAAPLVVARHGAVLGGTRAAVAATGAAASPAIPAPPRGYKLAWKDDRLNPMRGIGTAQGQAQQDRVWTRDVPAVLVTASPQTTASGAARPRVMVSTKSAPEAPAVQISAAYVQIGSFGEPANAEAAKARLRALGMPVSTARVSRKGKKLQIVYAGPFASAAQARAALDVTRGAGFGDAVLR